MVNSLTYWTGWLCTSHNPISLGPCNIEAESKAGSHHATQTRKLQRRKSSLRQDFDFDLMLVKRRQGLRGKRLTVTEFLLSCHPNHDMHNTE